MKKSCLLLMMAMCIANMLQGQDMAYGLHLRVAANGLCANLQWHDDSVRAAGDRYVVYCRFPDSEGFDSIGQTADEEAYHYCFARQTCGDTVLFYVARLSADGSETARSEATGDWFDDPSPTADCQPDKATVDSVSQQIVISWHPSPDDDIMGYYICSGSPCIGYDTVWGREDTSYLCVDHSINEPHIYRVLAFDSCMHASALTPYYGNLVLKADIDPCTRMATFSWNDYPYMEGGVDRYLLHIATDDSLYADSIAASEPLSATLQLDDYATFVSASVSAIGKQEGLSAHSNRLTVTLDSIVMARYIRIAACRFDGDEGCVAIEVVADSEYATEGYTLYRAADGGELAPIAHLDYSPDGSVGYCDRDLRLQSASAYTYVVGVADRCGVRERRSAPATVELPSALARTMFCPNAFTPLRTENNRFCPTHALIDRTGYDLYIYDRMGALVFHTDDPAQCWDGTKGGAALPQGVYTYMAHFCYLDGKRGHQCGTVMLLK